MLSVDAQSKYVIAFGLLLLADLPHEDPYGPPRSKYLVCYLVN